MKEDNLENIQFFLEGKIKKKYLADGADQAVDFICRLVNGLAGNAAAIGGDDALKKISASIFESADEDDLEQGLKQ